MTRSGLSLRPLPASLLLLCTGVGAVAVIGFFTFAVVPVVLGAGLLIAFLAGAVVFGWAGIEALAALERWMENDPHFKR
ncbi:glypican [Synechococcus sp. CS-1325]|uniref:glypican n=1 Tax=unclassified Synechococcus TaxID=2626047 RepID=UPI000DB47105|nr:MULTISPECIES: glypican [unclassified Synechococcus]PZV01061.1 MAG: glypican [Cyanobium sp.]MCT0199736.1 glypican [Synechococcus sp. CS-1325]MCT0214244.1 glypican [Synechococcus sp. CS-1326]MCT0231287.1 glypican [Synechococcus sp. CS-1324]MCT0232574.1 glypican [Synechococcus sp. CS-1327]